MAKFARYSTFKDGELQHLLRQLGGNTAVRSEVAATTAGASVTKKSKTGLIEEAFVTVCYPDATPGRVHMLRSAGGAYWAEWYHGPKEKRLCRQSMQVKDPKSLVSLCETAQEYAPHSYRLGMELEKKEYFLRASETPSSPRKKRPELYQITPAQSKELAGKYAICTYSGLRIHGPYDTIEKANEVWLALSDGSRMAVMCCNRLDRCWQCPTLNPLYSDDRTKHWGRQGEPFGSSIPVTASAPIVEEIEEAEPEELAEEVRPLVVGAVLPSDQEAEEISCEEEEGLAPLPAPPKFIDEDGQKVRPSEAIAAKLEPYLPTGKSPDRSAALEKMIETLFKEVERKRQTHANANLTRKRLEEQKSAFTEADRMEEMILLLRSKLDGNGPGWLDIRYRSHVEFLVHRCQDRTDRYGYTVKATTWEGAQQYYANDVKALKVGGLGTWEELCGWVSLTISGRTDNDVKKWAQIRSREKELATMGQIEGFYPTPPDVIDTMLTLAHIDPSGPAWIVLEPSAGSGSIADKIRERSPQCSASCIERNWSLRQLLMDKGHTLLAGDDFLAYRPEVLFDRICMNPPFEKLSDIDHVLHAYECLNRGGRLVSVMSTSFQHSSVKKAVQFRDWLEDHSAQVYEQGDAFKRSLRPVAVQTVIVVIDRE